MPAPNAFTNLTVTPVSNSFAVNISADHDGANLDRIEVRHRDTGSSDPWELLGVFDKDDWTLVTTTYSTPTPLPAPLGKTFVVRAISVDGLVSP